MNLENPIVLYRVGRFGGVGDLSPFVYKVETYMRMAGIEHKTKADTFHNLAAQSPHGLVPFISVGGEIIDDSTIIIDYLEEKYGDPLQDRSLTRGQLARGKLIKSLCERELLYIMVYGRWLDGDHKPCVRYLNPGLSTDQMEKAYIDDLKTVEGILDSYRFRQRDHSLIQGWLRECLDALDEFAGDGPYLFGESPSKYDAGFYAAVASFIHYPIEIPHVKIARSYPKLVEYCDSIREEYYDIDDWVDGK